MTKPPKRRATPADKGRRPGAYPVYLVTNDSGLPSDIRQRDVGICEARQACCKADLISGRAYLAVRQKAVQAAQEGQGQVAKSHEGPIELERGHTEGGLGE